jgi:hypothetical protein
VNDRFKLRVDVQPREQDRESVPAHGVSKAVEKPFGQGIECATEDRNMSSPSATQNTYP